MDTHEWHRLRHFSPDEFADPEAMDHGLMQKLDRARGLAGAPIYVTSSYREGDPRTHGKGRAVDIADNLEGEEIGSRWRFKVVGAALEAGFRRVGVYDRHVHLDVGGPPDYPPDVLWVGVSD